MKCKEYWGLKDNKVNLALIWALSSKPQPSLARLALVTISL